MNHYINLLSTLNIILLFWTVSMEEFGKKFLQRHGSRSGPGCCFLTMYKKERPARELSKERGRCRMSGCGKRRYHIFPGRRSGGYSQFCINHTCPNIESAYECKGFKRSGNRYCLKHYRCPLDECNAELKEEERHAFELENAPNWWCPKHAHLKPPSMGPRVRFGALMTCAAAKCPDLPKPPSLYCERHVCSHEKCTAGRHEEDAHCEKHLPCKHESCDKHRVKKGGKLAKFCDAHHECGDHLGDENHKCKTVLLAETGFCNEHRCAADKCNFNRENWHTPENRYCKYHTCHRPKCTEQTENTDKKREHKFCSRHTCQIKKCMAEVDVRSDDWPFCREHDIRLHSTPPTSLDSIGSSIADEDSDASTRGRWDRTGRREHRRGLYFSDPRYGGFAYPDNSGGE